MFTFVTLVTAAGAAPADIGAIFLQYGVLGAFSLIALAFFRAVYRRETERADRAEAQLAELNRDVREKIIPVLTEANRLVAESALVMRSTKGGNS